MNDEEILKGYEYELKKQGARGSETVSLLCAIFFPLFAILDFKNNPTIVWQLISVKILASIFFISVYIKMRKTEHLENPFGIFGFLILVAGFGVTVINYIIGFEASPKYGILLIIIGSSILCPSDGHKAFYLNAMLAMIFAFGAFFEMGTSFINDGEFLFHLFIAVTTGTIGATASHLFHVTKRRLFFSLFEAEQVKSLIRKELKSKKVSLSELAKEIAETKHRLEVSLKTEEEAKCKAQKAMQLRDEFISVASHELKTPVTVLKTQAEILKMGIGKNASLDLSNEEIDEILESCNKNMDNISRLIDDMRDVTKIETGNLKLYKEKVDLEILVKRVLKNFKLSNGLDVTLVSENKVIGRWDPFRIEQVVVNLVSNAMKYGDQKHSPEVYLNGDSNKAYLSVKDFGGGLTEDQKVKIFEKFSEVSRIKGVKGLGLGLYITKKIVEAHKGVIKVESQVGKGSTFKVELPLG